MGAPGFDDAPMFESSEACLPRPMTLIYPYYENPKFLRRQIDGWSSLPSYCQKLIRVIVVDDGSPKNPALSVLAELSGLEFNLSLYRIEVDVRWNWLAARNIGAHHAPSGWCVFTDMDHVLPERTIDVLANRVYDPNAIYRFSREEHTGAVIHPHPNSMFMTKDMFWKVGGYDEALSGHYGTDGDWRRRCAATAKVFTLRQPLIRHEYQGDSSTVDYLRKQPQDAAKKAIIKTRKPGWRPKTLSFPYHQVAL